MENKKPTDEEVIETTMRLRKWIEEELKRLGVSSNNLDRAISMVMVTIDPSIASLILSVRDTINRLY